MPVPLDWSDLGGEQINLAVIKKSASKPDLPIGAMFVGPGGPGVAAIGMVRGGDDRRVGRRPFRRDLLGPPGTNASSPVECFASDAEAATLWNGAALPSTPRP